jgi:tetratricopeptide (TPR) repeat protein
VSRSPAAEDDEADPYLLGWAAVGRLLRRGFSWSGHERNCAFVALGGGRFADASATMGFDFPDDGRAVARVDWDLDGDLDVLLTCRSGPRLRYLQNTGAGGRALDLLLQARGANRDAVGARVEVTLSGDDAPVLLRTQRAGEGFLAQSTGWVHVGVGERDVARVRVRWPGGDWEDFGAPRRGRRWTLVEGSGAARAWSAPSVGRLATTPPPEPPAPRQAARVVAAAPLPMPRVHLLTRDVREAAFFGIGPGGPQGTGKPLVLHLWASWCAPCVEELAAFAAVEEQVDALDVDIVALSVDDEDGRAAALARLDALEWPYSRGFALPETVELLDALQATLVDREQRLPLPSTFLVDPRGYLQVVYLGPIEPARVLADLALIGLPPGGRRLRAMPFPGRFLRPPEKPDLARYEGTMVRRGLDGAATEFALGRVEVRALDELRAQLELGRARVSQERFADAAEHFARATELDPANPQGWAALGWCLHRDGRVEDALAPYEEALRLEPGDDTTRLNLGLAYLALDRRREMVRVLQELKDRASPLVETFEARIRAHDR